MELGVKCAANADKTHRYCQRSLDAADLGACPTSKFAILNGVSLHYVEARCRIVISVGTLPYNDPEFPDRFAKLARPKRMATPPPLTFYAWAGGITIMATWALVAVFSASSKGIAANILFTLGAISIAGAIATITYGLHVRSVFVTRLEIDGINLANDHAGAPSEALCDIEYALMRAGAYKGALRVAAAHRGRKGAPS